MTDPTVLTRHDLSRLVVTRNVSIGVTATVGTFMTLYRIGAGSWPLTGAGGESEVSIAPSAAVYVVLGVILIGAASLLRGNVRALLWIVAAMAAFVGLLAFARWVGVGLVMQAVWLLVAVAIGCAIVAVWAGRMVWYARKPSRWHRRLDRIAARAELRGRFQPPGEAGEPVVLVNHAPPPPRRPAEPLVIRESDLDGIDLSDDADAGEQPADQWGR